MGSLNFELLHPDFGARVRGVSLEGEVADETVEEIKKAIDTFSLLCFPEQPMNDKAQIAFTRKLGEPEAEHVTFGKTGKIVYFGTVGNVLEDRSKRDGTHPNTRYQQGNDLWHSDSSFRDIPSYLSINHAYGGPQGRRRNRVFQHAYCVSATARRNEAKDRRAEMHP